MTLASQLRIAAWLAGAAVLLVLATLGVAWQQLATATAHSNFAGSLNANGISGLRTVTIEYVLNPSPRPQLQWWQRHKALAALLERSPFDDAPERAQIDAMRARLAYVGELFPQLTQLREITDPAGDEALARHAQARLVAQILIATEDMVYGAQRLLVTNLAEAESAARGAAITIAAGLLVLGAVIAAGLLLAVKGVLRPIHVLQHSAEVIGSGQLDHRTRLTLDNEIGDLSRAFDEMAARLAASLDTLQLRSAELENANKELESFSYSVSHDLRAPLRGLDGWSLALEEDLGDRLDDSTRSHLGFIRAEAKRMGQLIDDLLMLSRVSRQDLVRAPVDLSRLAHTIAERLIQAHPQRSIEIVVEPGMQVTGDARLLDIALTNLLDNACKFTAKAAAARIEVAPADAQASEAAPGHDVFCVRDNGVGFDMAHAGKLFGAFQRLHRPSEFPGTGIGLATVQRIVRRHGGRVWPQAAPDQGATFYFCLPRSS